MLGQATSPSRVAWYQRLDSRSALVSAILTKQYLQSWVRGPAADGERTRVTASNEPQSTQQRMEMAEGHNTGPLLVAVTSSLLVLATISVAARCYNQIVLLKRFQIEDWLAVITWLVFAFFTAICCIGVHYGLGKPVADVPLVEDRMKALFFKYIGMTTYVAASGLIKFVVGLYLLKLFTASHQKWQTRFLWVLLIIVGIVNTAYFFISIFQCNPIERFWLQWDPEWPKQGRCLKTWAALSSTYTVNIVNIIADAALAVLPISLVWNSKMDKRTKWSVVAILSVGSAASICTVIRVPYVYQLLANKEYLANFIELGVWSAVEIGLAIIASSAATLRPLFRKLKLLQTTMVQRSRNKSGHSRSRSLQMFSRDRKGSTGNALAGHEAQLPKSAGSKGLGSFGGSTYGTDTKISFSQALGNKKSYATLEGDTLNDPSDDIANGDNLQLNRRSSPIHVRTTISVDVEKGEGADFISPAMHPRYHSPMQSPASDHRRTDSEERSMWGRREQQPHQFHIPQTHQRKKTRDHELSDLEEVSIEGSRPERLPPPRTPRSPFPMISPTSTLRSPSSPFLGNMPSPYTPTFAAPSPAVNNNINISSSSSSNHSPYSPSFSPSPLAPAVEIHAELQQPQPTHQPNQHTLKPQISLLPVPPARESDMRRLSSPM
ncbi:hypothetical protein MCOR31_010333 [Pyricularia oryzae]|nr:hypothetical protein MCOR31_010333 [Pyricularia oryzae]KAI6436115.1 hypothetical protein MCOR22_009170 [Pyricularia oryzae]KAI6590229.1 hypothetical protein MCOR06_005136 [Pyricularia oryzae]